MQEVLFQLIALSRRAVAALEPTSPQCFYIFGHAYEFDIRNEWDRFEEFCAKMSGKEDIFYGTNKEVLLGE